MLKIAVDTNRCAGYGECALTVPGVFSIGEDNRVVVDLAKEERTDRDVLRRAVSACPVGALRLVERAEGEGLS
ncbi:MAG: ferredoxin [Actinomycetota bacterium]|jgi:ferredoxin|nr:ferredoxin [Actinomycetota bacterium]